VEITRLKRSIRRKWIW